MTQPAWQPHPNAEGDWHLIRLRRDGQPPLRFEGQLLAHFDGHDAAAPVWHELALYRVASGDYAVQITALLRATADAKPQAIACDAGLLPTLEQAVAAFEQHDATQAATPGRTVPNIDFADPTVPPARLMLQATRLAALQRDIARRYRTAVGALLVALAGPLSTHTES